MNEETKNAEERSREEARKYAELAAEIPLRGDDFHKYADHVAEFEAREEDPGKIIFYGASHFTRWSEKYGVTNLEDVLRGPDGSLQCVNFGFGGCHIHQMLEYYPRVVPRMKPRAIVLCSMHNFSKPGYSEAEVMALHRVFFTRVHADLPDTRIYVTTSYPQSKPISDKDQARRFGFTKFLDEFAAAHDYVTVVHVGDWPMFYLNGEGVGTYRNIDDSIYTEDGVHLNPKGYGLVAEMWKKELKEELAR